MRLPHQPVTRPGPITTRDPRNPPQPPSHVALGRARLLQRYLEEQMNRSSGSTVQEPVQSQPQVRGRGLTLHTGLGTNQMPRPGLAIPPNPFQILPPPPQPSLLRQPQNHPHQSSSYEISRVPPPNPPTAAHSHPIVARGRGQRLLSLLHQQSGPGQLQIAPAAMSQPPSPASLSQPPSSPVLMSQPTPTVSLPLSMLFHLELQRDRQNSRLSVPPILFVDLGHRLSGY